MNFQIYKQAVKLEETNPKKSLEIYKNLQKENKVFDKDVFIAYIYFPFLASIIAFYINQSITYHKTIITLLIVIFLGFVPPWLIYGANEWKKNRTGSRNTSRPRGSLIVFIAFGAYLVFLPSLELFIITIIGAFIAVIILFLYNGINHLIMGVPFVWPWELPDVVITLAVSSCFLFVLFIWASNVRITPISIKRLLKEIPIGLRLNSHSLLVYFASVALVILVITPIFGGLGPFGIAYDEVHHLIITNCFTGLLIGYAISSSEKDYNLTVFYEIAIARCLIRLNRLTEARHRLELLVVETQQGYSLALALLVSATLNLIKGISTKIKRNLKGVIENINEEDKYKRIYIDNINKTKKIAGLDKSKDLKVIESSNDTVPSNILYKFSRYPPERPFYIISIIVMILLSAPALFYDIILALFLFSLGISGIIVTISSERHKIFYEDRIQFETGFFNPIFNVRYEDIQRVIHYRRYSDVVDTSPMVCPYFELHTQDEISHLEYDDNPTGKKIMEVLKERLHVDWGNIYSEKELQVRA